MTMYDQEVGTCDICKDRAPLQRTYYRYDIKCKCCNGPNDPHFEICFHCDTCEPKAPSKVTCWIDPIKQ